MQPVTIEKMAIPETTYRLRWRFIFQSGKDKLGIWNGVSPRPEDSAWAVNKTGLAMALIEGENLVTYEVKELLAIDGQNYAFCQYEAFARVPGMGPASGSWRLRTHISGMSILTNDKKFTVWVNGQVESRDLDDHERAFNFKEHQPIGP